MLTLARLQKTGHSRFTQTVETTPVSPAQPGVNVRLYDTFVPVTELGTGQRQMVAISTSHTEHELCTFMIHAILTWTRRPPGTETRSPQSFSLSNYRGLNTAAHTGAVIHGWSRTPHPPGPTLGGVCPFSSHPPPKEAPTALPCPPSATRGRSRRAVDVQR